MARLIDCFTFYNEIEILQLRLSEIYEVVDKFILVEADKTFKGEDKPFIFEENKEKFSKWMDKIIHIRINFPDLGTKNPWEYEKYQRNSFMQALYFLGLSDSDQVMITDVDEIPDASTISYIKTYPLKGLYKLEMENYMGCFRNKMSSVSKWYHPKIMTWDHLKCSTPNNCRNDFDCQWWERGGWHLSYFGGSDRILNKINSFSHQEYNNEKIKNKERIIDRIKNNNDFLDEWRTFINIDPENNPYLPKNWRILEKYEEEYFPELYPGKDLVIGAAVNIDVESILIFVKSLRLQNKDCDIVLIVEDNISQEKKASIKNYGVSIIFSKLNEISGISNVNNLRYFKFYEFLRENEGKYRNVLISDIRDVYFQKDPFESIGRNSIFFAQEDEGKNIESDDIFNSRWIKQTYGIEIFNKIKDYKITCCGTVLGSYNNCIKYSKFICDEIIRLKNESNPFFSDMLDTAIHTYLYYLKGDLLNNPTMKENGDLFGTVGITSIEFTEKIDIKNGFIEVNKKVPAIIHQYDRSNWLNSYIKIKIEDEKSDFSKDLGSAN
jgi:beta-1,4-mannosyl-glycoprotein beta-1,4-N-acetylglucosaminyltransferase